MVFFQVQLRLMHIYVTIIPNKETSGIISSVW